MVDQIVKVGVDDLRQGDVVTDIFGNVIGPVTRIDVLSFARFDKFIVSIQRHGRIVRQTYSADVSFRVAAR